MRKLSNKLILILLLSSIVLPFFPITVTAQSTQIPRLKIGITGGLVGSWDGVVATSGYHNLFGPNAMEQLMQATDDWSGEYDDLIPVLATNWTIHDWPEEINNHPTAPFLAKGGIRAIDITLREEVKFHDGSDFNATVAKWNIDRICVMSGNITGSITPADMGASKERTSWWVNAEEWVDYETASWNVSQFVGQPGTYAEFGASEEAAMVGLYCRVKNVTILDDKTSGGTIRVNFNDWGGAHSLLLYIYNILMISMQAYKDYFDLPMYGLGQDAAFPQPQITGVYPDFNYPTTVYPGHMIGTGPYIFMEQEEHLVGGGWMVRNPNWWNTTAAQAEGWHKVPEIGFLYFYDDTAGFTARNLAMVTGEIDLAYDALWSGNLVYEEMVDDPDINYFNLGYEATRTFITLNQINETYWKDWADSGAPAEVASRTDLHDIDLDGTVHTDGINRALRKALSFAYNYSKYINNVLGGRGIRAGGFLGVENEYYNPNIPIPYQNLTIARQALLDDPYWAPKLAAPGRNLDITNETDDWIWVANNDPIFEFTLMWEAATKPQADIFSTSIRDIGIRLATAGPKYEPDPSLELIADLYQVMIMRINEFPAFTYHGVPTNWPDINVGNIPVLEYYYKSPGLPYNNGSGVHWPSYTGGQFFNIGFHYNATVDRWIELMRFSDRATSQELMNNLSIHCQTYQYPEIFISHIPYGFAIDKDWEHDYQRGEIFAFIKYLPASGGVDDPGVQIPGFDTVALLAITSVTITGIGLSLNRKRKHAKK